MATNDYGGFDRRLDADLWQVRLKVDPLRYVWVFASTWYEARSAAQRILHESFDAFVGDKLDDLVGRTDDAKFAPGVLIAICSRNHGQPTGGVNFFRAMQHIKLSAFTPTFIEQALAGWSDALEVA